MIKKKPWYMDDNVIIFAFTFVMLALVFFLIFYMEVVL